ncbi:uncharacterized protein FFB14_01312 [Fusarium fujikuroi]|nr:uncharacterized protein FFB14_01312 [Fusarium fujikuroi]
MSHNIDQLAKDCGKCFERLEEQLGYSTIASISKYNKYVGFKNLQSRFTRWKRNAGADSLQQDLHNNTRIRSQFIRLLSHIRRLLEDALAITVGSQVPWDQIEEEEEEEDSQSEEEGQSWEISPETEIEQILAHIADSIDDLSYLGAALRDTLTNDRNTDETSRFELFDVQYVLSKYPVTDKVIAERLGKAISARRQRFQNQQSTEQSSHHSKGSLADEPTLEALISQLDLEDLTYWGTERKGLLDENSSETSSVASEDLQAPRIPPLPQRATDERPIRCPCCQQMIRVLSTKDWKKHVYRDLRPYICLEHDCSAPHHRYARQKDWIHHVLEEHWRIYACPFGCNLGFTSRNGCRDHLSQKHVDQRHLSEIEDLVQLSTVGKTEIPDKTTCPLCKKLLQNIETYRNHIGQHQKQLALLAISLDPTMAEEASLQPSAETEIDEHYIASQDTETSENEGPVSTDKGKKVASTLDDSGLGEQSDTSKSKSESFPGGREDRWGGRRKSEGKSFPDSSSSNPGRSRRGLSCWQCCNCDCGWMRLDINPSCPLCGVPRCGSCIYC